MPRFALRLASAVVLAIALAAASASRAAAESPAVVELFTSQGCSSCPPADAYLDDLAKRPDVIALGFHVDYWNYIGWSDPFSSPEWSSRQRAYGETLKRSYVYTPQIVVDGAAEAVGSRRDEVDDLIRAAQRRDKLAVALSTPEPKMVRIRVAGREGYDGPPATVWVAVYDRERVTRVHAGENRGRVLRDRNIVRELAPVGTWQGKPLDVSLALRAFGAAGHDACAVLVQVGGTGRILGAAKMALASRR